jgi:hypothetical protein
MTRISAISRVMLRRSLRRDWPSSVRLRSRKIYRRIFFRRDDCFRRSLSPVGVDEEMTAVSSLNISIGIINFRAGRRWLAAISSMPTRRRSRAKQPDGSKGPIATILTYALQSIGKDRCHGSYSVAIKIHRLSIRVIDK